MSAVTVQARRSLAQSGGQLEPYCFASLYEREPEMLECATCTFRDDCRAGPECLGRLTIKGEYLNQKCSNCLVLYECVRFKAPKPVFSRTELLFGVPQMGVVHLPARKKLSTAIKEIRSRDIDVNTIGGELQTKRYGRRRGQKLTEIPVTFDIKSLDWLLADLKKLYAEISPPEIIMVTPPVRVRVESDMDEDSPDTESH
jgi:hypothetical protein